MKRRVLAFLVLALAFASTLASPRAQTHAPIVILVSFDGWRWDYFDRALVPNVKALAARGVRAKELIPSFPSLTFPNHYTIVTGLYPGHHGIVENSMWDPMRRVKFTLSSPEVRNGEWWGGEPIWVTAVMQGLRAHDMFWPGSEAAIKGVRPNRWWPFDGKVLNEERVDRVLDWLALPEAERPSLVTLYFQEVDHAGHVSGPNSAELLEATVHLDAALGHLVSGVKKLGLEDRTTIVLVSDHGMTNHTDDMMITVDAAIDPASVNVISTGELLQVAPIEGRESDASEIDRIYRALKGRLPHLTVYKRDEVPERYHYRDSAHIAPIIGVPDLGWMLTTREQESKRRPNADPRRGAHGYDPAQRDMHGLFIAAGPPVREGMLVEPFENIQIYDFLCALLKLTPAPNDGNPAATRSFLRN
jgi:predicted AlkP superfamily pyrophosphatase or phosphodiesterase